MHLFSSLDGPFSLENKRSTIYVHFSSILVPDIFIWMGMSHWNFNRWFYELNILAKLLCEFFFFSKYNFTLRVTFEFLREVAWQGFVSPCCERSTSQHWHEIKYHKMENGRAVWLIFNRNWTFKLYQSQCLTLDSRV